MADSDFDKIIPADLDLGGTKPPPDAHKEPESTALGVEEVKRSDEEKKRQTRVLTGIFFLLLFLVGGVIFILPRFVSPPDAASTRVVVVDTQSDTAAPANQVSPFEEAQKLRQRETAQNILAELLDLQESLEDKEAQTWATEEFEQVFELAAQGDTAYREQNFIEASTRYQEGLNILQALDADLPNVFSEYLAAGEQAILDGNPTLAEESFNIAVLINPDSDEAITGYDRSQILADVLGIIAQGEALHETGEFEQARDYYRQALNRDPDHQGAATLLEQVNQDILDRDFSAAMSRGFTALGNDNPGQAETAFREALALKPQSPEANAALEQTVSQMTLSAINVHLDAAGEFVSQEQWQQALNEYDAALKIDPNLASAREQRSDANSRNNLDNYLETVNQDPLRLAENSVYQQAVGIYNEAVKIPGDWPRLDGQLRTLRNFLERANEPVTVRLQSDGQTNVTVYKVGELGQFMSQTLDLTPGSYVAVGVREGYRDVREEFTVGFDGQGPVVTVQCQEEIL